MSTTCGDRGRASCDPCELRTFKRTRYFDGQLLTAADLRDEQAYLRGKDRLHNSHLHGHGTVCGLRVAHHPKEACRDRFVILESGLALDCCGHEIVVPENCQIDLAAKIAEAFEARGLEVPADDAAGRDVFLRLVYRECDTQKTASLGDPCGCADQGEEYGRTCESWDCVVDIDPPEQAAIEPLDVGLEWQNTLTVAQPVALASDRDIDRLYLAEIEDGGGFLRMFDAETHRLLVRVRLGADEDIPSALARSSLGDLIYVAIDDGGDSETGNRVDIFEQTALENDGAPVAVRQLAAPDGSGAIIGLAVSARDDSLLALTGNGILLRWTSEQLRGAGGDPIALGLGGAAPSHFALTDDGRWIVIADDRAGAPALLVVNVPQLHDAAIDLDDLASGDAAAVAAAANLLSVFPVPHDDGETPRPSRVRFSFDGAFVHVTAATPDQFLLYRIEVGDTLETFVPLGADTDRYKAVVLGAPDDDRRPVDFALSSREHWAFVLYRLFDGVDPLERSDVVPVALVELADAPQSGVLSAERSEPFRRPATRADGVAIFEELAFFGTRLYVAGTRTTGDDDEVVGSISILAVDEEDCASIFRQVVDGCITCDGDDGVVVASIRQYREGLLFVLPEAAEAEDVPGTIDNHTDRPLVPSTNTLKRVIDCMLAKGIEGIPGPRGPRGLDGAQGDPGQDGADGDDGLQGPPGVVDTDVTLFDPNKQPGTNPDATLVGQTLEMDLPLMDFARVVSASWHHDQIVTIPDLLVLMETTGLAIGFSRPIRRDTLHERSVRGLIRYRDRELGTICSCQWPFIIEGITNIRTDPPQDINWLIGNGIGTGNFELITGFDLADDEELVRGVRLRLATASDIDRLRSGVGSPNPNGSEAVAVEVRLVSDFILDRRFRALDGNHVWPGVPDVPSGNGAQGGDWLSMLHFVHEQLPNPNDP